MLTAPVDHPLSPITQDILTYGSYGLWLVFLLIAMRMGMKEKTPFYVIIIFAAAVGAFAEPLYDVAMMLYFYSGPGLYHTFTSFDIPQPIWTHSGYVVLYAAPAIYMTQRIAKGLDRKGLFFWAGVEMTCSCVFEMIGINGVGSGGAYAYWGPHVFRVFEYPLIIGLLETAQVVVFSVAAAELRRRSSGLVPLLGLFVLFPCTFFFANFGAGAPTIVALHLENTTPTIVAAATLISAVFALVLIWGASCLLPSLQKPAR